MALRMTMRRIVLETGETPVLRCLLRRYISLKIRRKMMALQSET